MVIGLSGGAIVDDSGGASTTTVQQEEEDDDLTAGEQVAQNFEESGSISVGGETVADNEEGVRVEGPADATDPTSIYEADREDLTTSGNGTQEDVDEFVENRDQSGANSQSTSAPSAGEMAGLGALTSGFDLDLGDTATQAAIAVVVLAALYGVSR